MAAKLLNVNGRKVKTVDLTYDELVFLYNEFIKINGRVPTTDECVSKNNLPQGRIVNRILAKNNITYKEFLLQFGKVKKVRTSNPEDYEMYVEKFKTICSSIGRSIRQRELTNNYFGLPSASWFIKYCPDNSITTYKQFLTYCGLEQNKHIWTKGEVSNTLIAYENKVGRPIISDDLCVDKVGVSPIVINRLFGSLSKAKEELGMMKTPPRQPLSFEHYKEIITDLVIDYKSKTSYPYITWSIIESGKYGKERVNHKSITKSFEDNSEDLVKYIKSFGLQFNPTLFSNTYTFDDGENVQSNYEYNVTLFLRSLNLKYQEDYFRSVRYNDFYAKKSKMTCDYLIVIGDKKLYIEVAGMIENFDEEDWKTHNYNNKVTNSYRDKMIYKETIFNDMKLNYLFIFKNEVENESFKRIIKRKMQSLVQKVA